jgi:hypothetical protein
MRRRLGCPVNPAPQPLHQPLIMSTSREPPGRRSRRSVDREGRDASTEDWATRGLAMVLAVPVFGFSLYLGLAVLTMSPRLAALIVLNLPGYFYLLYLGTALTVGLRFGLSGLTGLLGHFFGTHFSNEADRRITLVLWASLIAATLAAYAVSEHRGA